jgi:hypothetical protein
MKTISFSVTVCTEFIEIQRLVRFLLQHKRPQDSIVVLFDEANGDPEVENFLRTHSLNGEFTWHKAPFDRDFAKWKNLLKSYCSTDYSINIDADEMPTVEFMQYIPQILEENDIDVIAVPRENLVHGITPLHLEMWYWRMDEHDRINWPDQQLRIFKNNPDIKWEGKVHERIVGYQTISTLPTDDDTRLYFEHHKLIGKQEKQNQLYSEL